VVAHCGDGGLGVEKADPSASPITPRVTAPVGMTNAVRAEKHEEAALAGSLFCLVRCWGYFLKEATALASSSFTSKTV